MALPAPHHQPRVHQGAAARRRLKELGLTAATLTEAVRQGAAWAATATPNDPAMTEAFLAWSMTIRTLRDQLAPSGWSAERCRNVELTVHPQRACAIVVARADDAVGDPSRTPKLVRPRGDGFTGIVDPRQLRLPFLESEDQIPDTWLLLFHLPEGEEEPRLELAQPWGMRRGQVTGWAERIIIDVPRRGGQVARTPDVVDPVEPEVEVRRRRA
jgi:hypothetical protein